MVKQVWTRKNRVCSNMEVKIVPEKGNPQTQPPPLCPPACWSGPERQACYKTHSLITLHPMETEPHISMGSPAAFPFRRGTAVGIAMEFPVPRNLNSQPSVKNMKILPYQLTSCFIIYFIFLLKSVHYLLNKFVFKRISFFWYGLYKWKISIILQK